MKLTIGIFILAACIVLWQFLNSYANKKTGLLKEKGYLFVAYFLSKHSDPGLALYMTQHIES
jgi:hypothetical protein